MAKNDEAFQLAQLTYELSSPVFLHNPLQEHGKVIVIECTVVGFIEMDFSDFYAPVFHFIDEINITAEEGDCNIRTDVAEVFIKSLFEQSLFFPISENPFWQSAPVHFIVVNIQLVEGDRRVKFIIRLLVFAVCQNDMYFIAEMFSKIICF